MNIKSLLFSVLSVGAIGGASVAGYYSLSSEKSDNKEKGPTKDTETNKVADQEQTERTQNSAQTDSPSGGATDTQRTVDGSSESRNVGSSGSTELSAK